MDNTIELRMKAAHKSFLNGLISIESLAVFLAILYLLLAVKQNIFCWLAAILSATLYFSVMYSAGLYMEAYLQIFYVGMAVYGWSQWNSAEKPLLVRSWSKTNHLKAIGLILFLTLLSGYLLETYTEAALPFFDALTTWGAVVATYMVAKKLNISVDTGKGYRALANISEDGGQEVPHLHFHLFGHSILNNFSHVAVLSFAERMHRRCHLLSGLLGFGISIIQLLCQCHCWVLVINRLHWFPQANYDRYSPLLLYSCIVYIDGSTIYSTTQAHSVTNAGSCAGSLPCVLATRSSIKLGRFA